MSKLNFRRFCLFGLLFIFLSCTKTEWLECRSGSVSLKLTQENESNLRQTPDLSIQSFTINIKDDQDEIVKSFDRYDEVDEQIYLAVGKYKAEAFSEIMEEAAFDSPTYAGIKSFEINDLSNTQVNVVCALSNIKVSTTFSDNFKEVFPKAYALVQNESGNLHFTNEESRSGYFNVSSLLVTVYTLTDENKERVLLTHRVDEVAPRDHYIFNFNTEEGDTGIDIEVDESTDYKEIHFTIPQDWLEMDLPTMDSDTDLEAPIEFVEGTTTPLNLTFEVPGSITQLIMVVDDAEMLQRGWPKMINLADLSESEKTFLAEKGITYSDKIHGETSASISLTEGLKYFLSDENQSKDYQIHFLIQDYFFPEVDLPVNIKVNPAILHASINDYETWSHSSDVHVNVEEGNPDFVGIAYKEKSGDVWLKNMTPISQIDKDLVFNVSGLKDNVEYEFKAVQNLNSSSIAEAKTEEDLGIPNHDFEDWVLERFGIISQVYLHHVWNSKNGSPWATVNETTTGHRGTFTNSPYETLSSTVRDGDAKSGNYSAKLYTVGYGKGSKAGNPVHKAAAELFLGEYNKSSKTRTYGIPFISRPVALKGFYKYQPFNDDQFIIEVTVENRDGGNVTVLAHKEFIESESFYDFKEFNIPLEYTLPLKATHLTINIKSTTKSEGELETESRDGKNLGSELLVDQLSLEYK
ncbi:DUF4493 domain-containing protein [Flammeovirga yaeyamensis]|uniref:DUF4493 domain-containing protein n=1 Tax=Flammeovirga yaeyamensis TaxID=367791 RepID=A0AAX1NBH3_9BACT|nr:DUF4493 domain-containing protein [Flammeovirga yaeyamensis]MBB3697162.1 hypothetical protein [Flammeovirga yaeyamensis]NMF33822.1 DUF4493 domain-containing protein [Flammeovirga yaeyamensis]QWG04914.1 DUF4493 domain-containing protein [Flammeovirga yaeyamensis]